MEHYHAPGKLQVNWFNSNTDNCLNGAVKPACCLNLRPSITRPIMRKTASTAMVTGLWLGLVLKAEGCMFCAFPHKTIKDRFERLCTKYKELTETTNCTTYTDAELNKFLIDEVSVEMIAEKVHRVLRVIEINQTLTDLPVFWNWLYGVKLPKLTQEGVSTTVINCSVCQEVELNCWNMKTCWPNQEGCKVGGIKRLNRKAEFYSHALNSPGSSAVAKAEFTSRLRRCSVLIPDYLR
ncbi:sperm-egg fusion protein TMEM95-like isoform X2 [Scyliorhinus torazame]|uniref:sperm-egg fusion protein TMEM95-like isoform X2 n=1 Tax=Scyliorhinus torazame TaxID=75743 RepID=UPI003B5CD3A4